MTSGDRVAKSEATLRKQLGFMAALPSDVALEIFSYITQRDCLTCMSVCRAWDDAIPHYAQHVWKNLKFSTQRISKQPPRYERCLGSHVKRVTLETPWKVRPELMHLSLQKLLDWECTEIRQLELVYWHVVDENPFIKLLKRLARRLTHLRLTASSLHVPLLHILQSSPTLTHLDIQSSDVSDVFGNPPLEHSFSTLSLIDYHTNLKYLNLDVVMNLKQLENILKRCPDLRCFITGNRSKWAAHSNNSIDLDDMFTWCPKLTFISVNSLGDRLYQAHDPDDYISDNIVGLHYLGLSCSYQADQLAQHLAKHQDTLESLSMYNHRPDNSWSPIFNSIYLPSLRELVFKSSVLNTNSLITLLNHCPNLETLDLVRRRQLTFNAAAIRSLHTMHHLRSLWCVNIKFADDLSLLTVLERFPVLEKLIMSGTMSIKLPGRVKAPENLKIVSLWAMHWKEMSSDDVDSDEIMARFLDYLTHDSKLEVLQLPQNKMLKIKSLRTIASISTLKVISVKICSTIQDQELLEFIHMLGEGAIESLALRNVNQLNFECLDALSNLPCLCEFTTGSNMYDQAYGTRTSLKGLYHMIRRRRNLLYAGLQSVQIEEDDQLLSCDQISKSIEEKAPPYHTFSVAPSARRSDSSWREKKLHDVTITRRTDIK